MENKFVTNWIVVVSVIGALLLGAWIGAQISSPGLSQDDWIAAIESGDSY